jgi:hypothetical protein
MQTQTQPITRHTSPPPAAAHYCECPRPIAEQRAERRGAARTYCVRCGLVLPLRMGRPS